MLALDLYESELCECGFHKSLAHDPEQWFDPISEKCPVCAGAAVLARRIGAENEREEKALKDKPRAERDSDGRRWLIKWRGSVPR